MDGARIHANASRQSARSYEQARRIAAQLKVEVANLLGQAEATDQADVPEGMSIPADLARRETRLAGIARAKAIIEARAAAGAEPCARGGGKRLIPRWLKVSQTLTRRRRRTPRSLRRWPSSAGDRRQAALRVAPAGPGAGVRPYQVVARGPAVPAARHRHGAPRVGPLDQGVEQETDVRPGGRLSPIRPFSRGSSAVTASQGPR